MAWSSYMRDYPIDASKDYGAGVNIYEGSIMWENGNRYSLDILQYICTKYSRQFYLVTYCHEYWQQKDDQLHFSLYFLYGWPLVFLELVLGQEVFGSRDHYDYYILQFPVNSLYFDVL